MKNLLLLCHSKAEPVGAVGDVSRELTPQGRRKCSLMVKKLSKKDMAFDLIMSSHATRARQTAEIIGVGLNFDSNSIVQNQTIYSGDYFDLLNIVRELPDNIDNVLIVGHVPTIYECAYKLASNKLRRKFAKIEYMFPTCAGMLFTSELNWSNWDEMNLNKGKLLMIKE